MGGGEGCGVSLWSGLAIQQPAPCALVATAPATNQRAAQNAYHKVNANNVSSGYCAVLSTLLTSPSPPCSPPESRSLPDQAAFEPVSARVVSSVESSPRTT